MLSAAVSPLLAPHCLNSTKMTQVGEHGLCTFQPPGKGQKNCIFVTLLETRSCFSPQGVDRNSIWTQVALHSNHRTVGAASTAFHQLCWEAKHADVLTLVGALSPVCLWIQSHKYMCIFVCARTCIIKSLKHLLTNSPWKKMSRLCCLFLTTTYKWFKNS